MKSNVVLNKEYRAWLAELKLKVRNAQLKAAVKVNSEMLLFYWDLGAESLPSRLALNGPCPKDAGSGPGPGWFGKQ